MLKPLTTLLLMTPAALAAIDAPAQAETRSEQVSYSDLDLATPEGQQALEHRISRAIRQVCGPRAGPLYDYHVRAACRREAKKGTEGQVSVAIARAKSRQDERLAAR